MPRKRKQPLRGARRAAIDGPSTPLRIIGGSMRGRKLLASGDIRTRPMKDRVREAVFNLLGPAIAGAHAIDVFAGSGALALEAISRGAGRATLIEHHLPTAELVRQNARELGVADRVAVEWADAFLWAQRQPAGMLEPWGVFCSPPYAFYVDRQSDMLSLVRTLLERAPAGSMFVVESDGRFDTQLLPMAGQWDVREYPPARIAIHRKP